ncbi:hypothetical protein ACRALDRAFT_2096918 [Sodiomyces alcalophilus JCM 7366]|uniref:uncharacterized protein n=1 Tax=Sodiomyces alcalophilus JCM 7366 TaxID=591952 RepID=UPI0039B38415
MSFFGFDSTRHNTAAPGFSQAQDPFAGLSQRNHDDDDAVDFEDTYDGLGDQLDESGDAFNDDTFGGGDDTGSAPVGKDFDFFGQTAKVSGAIEEEHMLYNRQQPAPKAAPASAHAAPPVTSSTTSAHYPQAHHLYTQPVRTGYEKYKEPEAEPIPDLHVDASLWGMPAKRSTAEPATQSQAQPPASGRKVLSLEEVERAMREQSQRQGKPPTEPAPQPQEYAADRVDYYGRPDSAQRQQPYGAEQARLTQPPIHHGHGHPVTILQRPQSQTPKQTSLVPNVPSPQALGHHQLPQASPVQPTQILQNPSRLSGDSSRIGVPSQPAHRPHGSVVRSQQHHHHHQQQHLQQQQHFAQLSEEDKAAYLDQETKRAKRNHKIWLLSKDNGLMTPQDKNFITRIQLQQLVSATGNPIETGNEGALAEDFYYQVLSQIRGGQRQNPHQPLSNFAQTYLFQTGSRQGGMRRQGRSAENHAQRMEQQVQRAVEAAKNKPKNPQLVIAGSLGKISFSNAKTPKPLLNIKRSENAGDGHRAAASKRTGASSTALDKKAILRNIERVYTTIMLMEDHARLAPAPPTNGNHDEFHAKHREWLATAHDLNARLWDELKVHEPIRENAVHPFIAFLTFPKGKKVFSRVFRHISFEQRTTILTMIIFHLDSLDVVRDAQLTHGEKNLSAQLRENIELFSMSVMPSLFAYFNDTQIDIVTGVLGIIAKLNVDQIAKTRVGTSMLTLVLSRAELLKQAGGGDPQLWNDWDQVFDAFFNVLEPTLPHMFPGSVNAGEDVLVWQLLAAIGVSANPEQQQRLVLAVKDRVLDTVAHAKTLPASLAAQRLGTVNLFMHSIGLDVELLQ